MCRKPQITKDQIRNANDRRIRPDRFPRQRNPKISSNRKRPCLRFLGLPKILSRCRKRNGLGRLKRETNENHYGRSVLHVHKVKKNESR